MINKTLAWTPRHFASHHAKHLSETGTNTVRHSVSESLNTDT